MITSLQAEEADRLLDALTALRARVARSAATRLQALAPDFPDGPPPGADNLAHYLALRTVDLRSLQTGLARLGLSSLGRSESHVMAALDQVIRVLQVLTGRPDQEAGSGELDFKLGPKTLSRNTRTLFGAPATGRDVRIMVTLPTEAAQDPDLARQLVAAGMDCARINCAHDDRDAWSRMIGHVRAASEACGRPCRIQMDLAGHKLRTGPLAPAQPVLRLRPVRDALGRTVAPASLALVADLGQPGISSEIPRLTMNAALLAQLRPGDRLRFRDARGKKRVLQVRKRSRAGVLLHGQATSYLTPDTRLTAEGLGEDGRWRTLHDDIALGGLPLVPVKIVLNRGDRLTLTREPIPSEPAQLDGKGRLLRPAHISCTTPEALDRLAIGQAVWIDDGKLGGEVEAIQDDGVTLNITRCRPQGVRLQADKGLNFPGADLGLSRLSAKDLEDLDFVAGHADLVGYSFVETREDMQALIQALSERSASHLGIVAKIETQRALAHLPEIILSTIGQHPLGIMIARGDLAVEIGGVRMAEIQEELLWLCEAAHVPVIWATQVLETMAKKGVITRPEVTDAAMSGRAECVMLNKGPYILEALHTLDDILRRMQEHQRKKTSRLRALGLAGRG